MAVALSSPAGTRTAEAGATENPGAAVGSGFSSSTGSRGAKCWGFAPEVTGRGAHPGCGGRFSRDPRRRRECWGR